ncbi:MAG: hypothetical protein CSA66_06315 [Proteobacteria bacterium]|nr:MAG: hypothetical protein CSA66_06315 [Pseudomonadota bacterium]
MARGQLRGRSWVSSIAALGLVASGPLAACGGEKEQATPPAAKTEQATSGETKAPNAAAGVKAAPGAGGKGEVTRPRRTIDTGDAAAPSPATGAGDAGAEVGAAALAKQRAPATASLQLGLTPGPAVEFGGVAGAEAFAYLPASTVFAAAAASPKRALDAIGFDALKAEYSEPFTGLSRQVKADTGLDLLSPDAYAQLGIDVHAPVGVALLSHDQEAFAVFATVADKAKLDETLKTLGAAGKVTFTRTKVGDAEIVSAEGFDRAHIVIRGRTVMAVVVDRHRGAGALAKAIAAQAPETSLSRAVEYTSAVAGLDFYDEAIVWANFGLVVKMQTLRHGRSGRSARQAAENELFQRLVGPLGAVALGARLRDKAVEVAAFMPLPKDAWLSRLAKNIEGTPVVVAAADAEPLFLTTFRLDIPAYMEVVELAMKAEGGSLDEIKAGLKEMANVDVDKDLLGALSGEAGVVVTGDVDKLFADRSGGGPDLSKVDGAFVLGLSNAAAMKAFLSKVAAMEGVSDLVQIDAASGIIKIPLPTGKIIEVRVAGDYLVASTMAGFADRVAARDGSKSFVASVTHPALKAALSRKDQAGLLVLPQLVVGAAFIQGTGSGLAPSYIDEEAKKDPKLAKKIEALKALRAEVETLETARQAKEQALMDRLFSRIGVTVQAIEVREDGLAGFAGQYLGDSLASAVMAIVTTATWRDGARGELSKLRHQIWDLEAAIRAGAPVEAAP